MAPGYATTADDDDDYAIDLQALAIQFFLSFSLLIFEFVFSINNNDNCVSILQQ